MKIILWGHIRDSFNNDDLYNLLDNINNKFNLEIFIQTWSIFSSSLSWRSVEYNNNQVTSDIIKKYFRKLSDNIKIIEILDENTITLHGRLEGKIGKSNMPIKGWKFMLYGMFHITEIIYKSSSNKDENILITRFDIMNNSHSFSYSYLINYITNNINTEEFLFTHGISRKLKCGCDNLMIGKLQSLYNLLYNMHKNLDKVLNRHPLLRSQEWYFIYEQNYLESKKKKCQTLNCTFKIHTNLANNNRLHCCKTCMTNPNNHGSRCEKMVISEL